MGEMDTVRLRTSDPRTAPMIRFNFLATDRDLREFRDGLRVTREITRDKALAVLGTSEAFPGAGVEDDIAIDELMRTRLETEFHPSCTCRMLAAVVMIPKVDELLRSCPGAEDSPC